MKTIPLLAAGCGLAAVLGLPAHAQRGGGIADTAKDPVQTLVDRLDFEKYKTTIKGLAQFGDRRQGTKRNRDAVTWIETQLKSTAARTSSASRISTSPPPPANSAADAAEGAARSLRRMDAAAPATALAAAASSATCVSAA